MNDKHSIQVDPTRRRFLIAAKGAGALGAIALLFGKGAAVETVPLQDAVEEPVAESGYRETEHIRAYYRTARYW